MNQVHTRAHNIPVWSYKPPKLLGSLLGTARPPRRQDTVNENNHLQIKNRQGSHRNHRPGIVQAQARAWARIQGGFEGRNPSWPGSSGGGGAPCLDDDISFIILSYPTLSLHYPVGIFPPSLAAIRWQLVQKTPGPSERVWSISELLSH